MSAVFIASYPGRCPACDGTIAAGAAVRYTAADELVHDVCPEVAALQHAPGDLCPRCFCRHRGEC